MNKLSILATFLALTPACASSQPMYKTPTGVTTNLRLEVDPIHKGEQYFGVNTSGQEGDLKRILPILSRGLWLQKNHTETTIKIPVDTRIIVVGRSTRAAGGSQFARFIAYCRASASFIPQVGEEYVAIERWQGQTCLIDVIQVSTNKAPDSLQLVPLD